MAEKADKKPEGPAHPGDIAALLGKRPAHLGHGERDGKGHEERSEGEQE